MSDSVAAANGIKDMEVVSFANGHGGTETPFPETNKDGEPFGGFALIINGHSLVSSISFHRLLKGEVNDSSSPSTAHSKENVTFAQQRSSLIWKIRVKCWNKFSTRL